MIDPEDEGGQHAAITYLADLEPDERTEQRDGDDVRVTERFDGPFDDDAPAAIRNAARVYLYTDYSNGGDVVESQEIDIYSSDDEQDE
ncbi:MAG: hypothetical protein M3O34_06540 [Chloroflexota bacterium]|nr:hypothetical protein [Chloroflexota bacterium]